MLKFSTLQAHVAPVALSPDEDKKLRLAFGRFAEAQHRQAGGDVVSVHYEKHRCFHCDCRPDVPKAPLLFLVTGAYIRREVDGKGTPHSESCDFAREPEEQKRLVSSYRLPDADKRELKLVRNFGIEDKNPAVKTSHIATHSDRPTLATVLCRLLHQAKLDRFFSKTPLHGGRDQQVGDLMSAAELFTLPPNQPLKHWLATSLRDYYRLKERLNHSMAVWERPHGIFIETFDRIENNTLYPKRSDLKPLPVAGRLTVFGEGEHLRRPPYLVIGLVSQPHRKAKYVELLNAYAHPCVAWDRLTLVDSQLERETLALLVACRDWLAHKHNIVVTIEKPLFDVGPPETGDPRDTCLPDFILRCRGNGILHPLVVVETMGYDNAAYRERKQRMRVLFEQVGPGPHPVPVIEHDRFRRDTAGHNADDNFCRSICTIICGHAPDSLLIPLF